MKRRNVSLFHLSQIISSPHYRPRGLVVLVLTLIRSIIVRVDAYLPLTATVKVSIGDKVSATTTILAKL